MKPRINSAKLGKTVRPDPPLALETLYAAGVLAPPALPFNLSAFLAMPAPILAVDRTLAQAVIAEREETRRLSGTTPCW